MVNSALLHYQHVEKVALEGRALEAHVLLKAAFLLQAAMNEWDFPGHDAQLDHALRNNMRLWSVLQSELEDPDNPLPDAIKANLISLTRFVDRRTIDILANPAKEKIGILVRINQNLAAGLSGSPQ